YFYLRVILKSPTSTQSKLQPFSYKLNKKKQLNCASKNKYFQMRKIFFLFLIVTSFLSTLTQAQNLETREVFPPDTNAVDDLHFLKEELSGKQMVLLGEHTHMFGNIFEMKSRLVEFLHQELGFTTFAIESPIYDIWKMNQQGFTPEA